LPYGCSSMKPVLQALVLAERVYEDKSSGKKIIAGTFNLVRIGMPSPEEVELPDGRKQRVIRGGTDPGCPSVYVSLTDVVDGTEISLQFVNMSKNQVMFTMGIRIESADRLATVEIVAHLPPFARVVREAGTFSLDVVWKGEILGSHRVIVAELPRPS
jgi:hypothetical protein